MTHAASRSRTRWTLSLPAMLGGLLLSACAVAPVQEMSDARQAVDAAVQAGGDRIAAAQMQAARAALTQAEVALRNVQYKRARELALQARTSAIEAQRVSAAR